MLIEKPTIKKSLLRPISITLFFLLLGFLIYLSKEKLLLDKTSVNEEKKEFVFPVEITNKDIQDVFIAYNFYGAIKSLEKTEGYYYKLTLDAKDPTTPEFNINEKEVTVYSSQNNEHKPTSFSDLKAGMKVTVSSTYDIKRQIWITRDIYIPIDLQNDSQNQSLL